MTKEQATKWLPFIQAWVEGKTVEYKYSNTDVWTNVEFGYNIWFTESDAKNQIQFRIVEPKKLRPWKPEEVPVGALFRWKSQTGDRNLITSNRNSCVAPTFFYHGAECQACYSEALSLGEHSLDNGATWLPCGIEE